MSDKTIHPITLQILKEAESKLEARIIEADNEAEKAAKKWREEATQLRNDLKELRRNMLGETPVQATLQIKEQEEADTAGSHPTKDKLIAAKPKELWAIAKPILESADWFTTDDMKKVLLNGHTLNKEESRRFGITVSDMFKSAHKRNDVVRENVTKTNYKFKLADTKNKA